MIKIGKVLKPHGLKGEVKVSPYTDELAKFKKYPFFFIDEEIYTVEHLKSFNSKLILKFQGIDTLTKAQRISNQYLCLSRNQLKEKIGDLIGDYIGLQVMNFAGNKIGTISKLLTGNNKMFYEIENSCKDRQVSFYIPCQKNMFSKINFVQKEITLNRGVI